MYDSDPGNMTDEDLIREFRTAESPVISELVRRLTRAVDAGFTGSGEPAPCAGCDDYERELRNLQDEHTDEINALKDELAETYEDRLDKLNEQLAHEQQRLQEFHDENRQLLAEIARLTAEAAPRAEEDQTMLDGHLDALTDRIAALEAKQDITNALLRDILAAIRGSDSLPPTPVLAEAVPADPSPEPPAPAPSPAAAQDNAAPESFTLDDVREAFISFAEQHGKEVAIGTIRGVAGEVKNITHIPEDKFAAVMAALRQDIPQEEAA